jgi:DNA (cytosine-5)-methyltransferase 1
MEKTLTKLYQAKGTDAPWYRGWDLTEEQRDRFRRNTAASQAAKDRAVRGLCLQEKYPIPTPRLLAEDLMPFQPANGLRSLSLFSGGGGLDIGFERAGFEHVASYEILEHAAAVLRQARPQWEIHGGSEGDVCMIDWHGYRGGVDVLHGGPPCQPFSHAGYRRGASDVRDMFPELVRAVLGARPRAFVAENVTGLATGKFEEYIGKTIYEPLGSHYTIFTFVLEASAFGVPQRRRRVFFVGFSGRKAAARFSPPQPTHSYIQGCIGETGRTMGAREALGLADIGRDGLAPTLRSGLTGPRHTTSVLSSVSALKQWRDLEIWPNGVGEDREKAAAFRAENGHFRLSIPDCMLLQGFPADWPVKPPVYKALGLIGNSVAPPMGYRVALAVAHALAAD